MKALWSILLLLCFISLNSASSLAQMTTFSGYLVYSRSLPGDTLEYITLSSDGRVAHAIEPDTCAYTSPNGIYLAQSSRQPDTLQVYRLEDDALVTQVNWQPYWRECSFGWNTENELFISSQQSDTNYRISLGSNTVFGPFVSPSYNIPDPVLPRLDYDDGDEVLQAPDKRHYFYERCTEDLVYDATDDEYECRAIPEWVIYDAQLDRTLTRIDYDEIGFAIRPLTHSPGLLARWSPNSRYVAFAKQLSRFDFGVYDAINEQYLVTTENTLDIDPFTNFIWSSDGTKVAFWLKGALREPEPGWEDLRTLVIYDVRQQESIRALSAYVPSGYPVALWEPTSESIVFVAESGDLIRVDASDGSITTIDTDVERLEAWRGNQPRLASFVLSDADTGQLLPPFIPFLNNVLVPIQTLPTNNMQIQANGVLASSSIVFDLDGTVTIDNSAPYTVQFPSVGSHKLKATPYSDLDGTGEAGDSLEIIFTVLE